MFAPMSRHNPVPCIAALSLLCAIATLLPNTASSADGEGDIYVGTTSDGVLTLTDSPPSGDESFSIIMRVLDGRPAAWVQVDPIALKKDIDRYDEIIDRAAAAYDVDAELIKAIVLVESGMNAKATSPAGAQGLMQLMPATAQSLGVRHPYDPNENIFGGAHYIRKMLDSFSDNHKLALAAYNAGPGNVRKYKGVPPFKETQYYVKKVFKYYNYFLSQRRLTR
jgi:soluble lytic murein transglycosylase-like protein